MSFEPDPENACYEDDPNSEYECTHSCTLPKGHDGPHVATFMWCQEGEHIWADWEAHERLLFRDCKTCGEREIKANPAAPQNAIFRMISMAKESTPGTLITPKP